MLYLFVILATVLIIVPLSLEWLTKGWHGTVVAKAWAEFSPSFGALATDVVAANEHVASEADAEQSNYAFAG